MFIAEHHFLAFLGSMSISLFLLREYVNSSLKSSKKPKVWQYIKSRLVLVLINVLLGQFIVIVQEYGFDLYADIFDNDSVSDLYIDHSEIISFLTGMLAAVILGLVLNRIKSKLNSI